VPVQILGNMDGLYSIQVSGATPSSTYYIEVAALNPNGSNNTGSYELGVKFAADAPVALALLSNAVLNSASQTDSATLTMNENGLFHFSLGAGNGSNSASAVVNMTLYDQNGNVILSLNASTGQPPATAVVYLAAGTYQIRYTVTSSSGSFQPINYWLFGEILSDPIGPYMT